MQTRFLATVSLWILFLGSSIAQIVPNRTGTPPELVCVKRAPANQISIQWNAPANTGPCFSQYAIYVAKGDRTGPYEKLDSVSASTSGTLNLNPSFAGNVYVFMVNEQSCNGAAPTVLTSDTLDNIVPQPAPIITLVTVENDKATINWQASANPEVAAYVIYSNVNNFNTPIDTVFGRLNTSYTDFRSSPSDTIAVYRIRSLEFCEADTGLLSNITPSYNTILVNKTEEEPCARSTTLSWNGYNNQSLGVDSYVVEYSTDAGNTFTTKATLPSTAREYIFSDLETGVVTCIRVKAVLPGGFFSNSNLTCIVGSGIAPVRNHFIQNISVESDGIVLEYIPDGSASFGEIAVERSTNGQSFSILTSGVSIQRPDPAGPFIIKDFSPLINRSSYWYKVSVRNICNNTFTTLPAKTIFLSGKNNGLDNTLTFEDLIVDSSEVKSYELYRITGTDTLFLAQTVSVREIIDKGVFSDNNFAEACYLVKGVHQFDSPNRPVSPFTSVSNVVCLKPRPQAFVPNAFAPEGTNKIFRPILAFASNENYLFEVFNRFGEKVFSSNIPGKGWDGQYKGSPSPLDSYIYHVRFTGLDGLEYTRTGVVILVR
jgi:gliding motility-associated-like protein